MCGNQQKLEEEEEELPANKDLNGHQPIISQANKRQKKKKKRRKLVLTSDICEVVEKDEPIVDTSGVQQESSNNSKQTCNRLAVSDIHGHYGSPASLRSGKALGNNKKIATAVLNPASSSCPQLTVEEPTSSTNENEDGMLQNPTAFQRNRRRPPKNNSRQSFNKSSFGPSNKSDPQQQQQQQQRSSLMNKTYSFKRMLSFRGSLRGRGGGAFDDVAMSPPLGAGLQPNYRPLQFSFLGQIYAKHKSSKKRRSSSQKSNNYQQEQSTTATENNSPSFTIGSSTDVVDKSNTPDEVVRNQHTLISTEVIVEN